MQGNMRTDAPPSRRFCPCARTVDEGKNLLRKGQVSSCVAALLTHKKACIEKRYRDWLRFHKIFASLSYPCTVSALLPLPSPPIVYKVSLYKYWPSVACHANLPELQREKKTKKTNVYHQKSSQEKNTYIQTPSFSIYTLLLSRDPTSCSCTSSI